MRRVKSTAPPTAALIDLAARVRYVGSAEHKTYPSFAGQPKLRADATKCDPRLTDPDQITAWLRAGIEAGLVGHPWEGDFPRYVWFRVNTVCYEGRLVNREAGEYKGYALADDESPAGI
jgi:hypothetical protein